MKSKLYILSTVISSCILSLACGQINAANTQGSGSSTDNWRPNMPSGSGSNQRCYPGSKCTGDPNLIGGPRANTTNSYNANNDNTGTNGNQANGGAPQSKVLKTESVDKFTGVVKSMNRVNLPNSTQVQMVLTTDQGDLLVIVGPANFLDQSKIKFVAGDKVVVTGYLINANGNFVVVASEISKNGNSLQLLNDKRQPVWGN